MNYDTILDALRAPVPQARRPDFRIEGDGDNWRVFDGDRQLALFHPLFLDDLLALKIAGLHPLQRTAGMSLAEVKANYGDRVCLIGNIDSSRTLPYGTPEEVTAEVRQALAVAAPGNGYVLASDHSLHDGIPVANILAMFAVERKS